MVINISLRRSAAKRLPIAGPKRVILPSYADIMIPARNAPSAVLPALTLSMKSGIIGNTILILMAPIIEVGRIMKI